MAMEANSLFSPFFFVTLFLGFFITILIMRSRSRVHKQRAQVVLAPLPPGPPRLPLIGNIHQLIGDNPHRILLQLARTHGPLVCLRLGQVYQVVASSVEAVEEIIKRHDLKFADRPTDLTFSKILNYDGNGVAMVPYGGKWKQGRKIYAMEMLNSRRVKSYATIRVDAVRKLTAEIAHKAFAETPVINLSEMAMSTLQENRSLTTLKRHRFYVKTDVFYFLTTVLTKTDVFETSVRAYDNDFWRLQQRF
ncbi:alpha-humulene 10-hydroxylase-like [Curcuma longa]|uniref:alpha-humulene 10-hydroxylase-like n=1 Tax=Curcuma longa TaxID=136217 RepID=UPI003D9E7356